MSENGSPSPKVEDQNLLKINKDDPFLKQYDYSFQMPISPMTLMREDYKSQLNEYMNHSQEINKEIHIKRKTYQIISDKTSQADDKNSIIPFKQV